jgi:hypothetical protein
MKRSPMPPRKEWMNRSSLRSSTPPAGGRVQPARRKTGKHVGETKAKNLARQRSGGECEVRSPWHQGPAREFSHRLAEGQGGKWLVVNGLDSCGHGNLDGCHGYIHQHPEEATKYGWMVSAWGDPETTPVLMWHDGRQDWFLLLDEYPWVELAEFPEGRPGHPDDLDLPGESRDLGGVA